MKIRFLLTALALTIPLTACSTSERADVLVSAYPFEYLTERISGDNLSVVNLTKPGVDAHDLELSPRQVADVQEAGLVIYVEHFQAAIDDALEQADRSATSTLDLGKVVDLLESGGHDDHEGHDEESEDDHEGHDHDHGDVDPHFWLDPSRMATAADAIAEALIETHPDHADEFRANADELIAELTELDEAFRTGLQTCERRTIVTAHSAFGYLASTYDLHQVAIAGLEPTQEPSSKQLAEITHLVESEGITTIFTEELVDAGVANTVASATGVATATLDPIEGLSDATANEDYLSLMYANLDALRLANGCA